VIAPLVKPWVEQPRQNPRIRVKTGQVWALVKVTEDAGPSEIFYSTFATVFFRNDVLDMKDLQVHRKIGQAAIFTPSACPAPANLTSAGGHRVDRFR